jgi:carbon-monoxide dehydrogenase medium subunit
MKPPLFEYDAPGTIGEAIALLQSDPGAMLLAGGQSLVPAMNFRLASPSRLVDIQHIAELAGITVAENHVVVRAMVRHRELELDAVAYRAQPLLRAALAHVAHIPIRNRGTIVGSLCHADAAAEMPVVLLLTGGSVVAEGPSGTREIGAENFFQFHMTTSRRQDEVVVEARFPALPRGAGYAFEEFTRRHGDYAIAAVGAIILRDARGGAAQVLLGACGVSSRPVRLRAAEERLTGSGLSDADIHAAAETAKAIVTAPDDMHATQDYRRHLLAALVGRAVRRAVSRAN